MRAPTYDAAARHLAHDPHLIQLQADSLSLVDRAVREMRRIQIDRTTYTED
jgi:hypothetical protein